MPHRQTEPNTDGSTSHCAVPRRKCLQRPSIMKGLLVPLLLSGLCQAVRVYLHPAPTFPPRLSAPHAGAALSSHLNLERFEDAVPYAAEQELFVGSGSGTGLLLTISEEDAKGTSFLPRIHAQGITQKQRSSLRPSRSPHSPFPPLQHPTLFPPSYPHTSSAHNTYTLLYTRRLPPPPLLSAL